MRTLAPRTNFQLARVFGIRIGVGVSWFVVLFLFVILLTPDFHEVLGGAQTTAYLVAVAVILSFFVSVILHELGHALVARRNGLSVAGIDLWAFGGLTRMREMAGTPGVQFRVAIAGPLVTLAMIVVCAVAAGLLAPGGHFAEVATGSGEVRATPALVWLSWVAIGQRVRAAVQPDPGVSARRRPDRPVADLVAHGRSQPRDPLDGARRAGVRAGAGRARTVGALSSGDSFGLFTMLLAFILYQAASGAVAQGAFGQRIAGVTVADIMDREPVTIPAELSLLDAQDQFFLRYRWPWFAVVDPARHFLGVVREQRVDEEIAAGRPALAVVDVLEENLPVRIAEDQPVESLLRSEGLGRLGAMVAVDEQGVLQGVVTVAQLRKAMLAGQRSATVGI